MSRLASRSRHVLTAAAGVIIMLTLLAALASAIATGRSESDSTIADRFALRVEYSADFVSGALSSVSERARSVASTYFEDSPDEARLALVCGAFGFDRCGIEQHGRLVAHWGSTLGLVPSSGTEIDVPAVGQVPVWTRSKGPAGPDVAIAVRFGGAGRVLVAALRLRSTPIAAFLHRVVIAGGSQVLLVDADGGLVGGSPTTSATTMDEFSPALAAALRVSDSGSVVAHGAALSYKVASVPGTSWRLVVAEPQAQLYAPVGGLQAEVPWMGFAIVAVLASALLVIFLRVLAGRYALQESWAQMEEEASTDPLTGLANRRQLEAAMRQLDRSAEPYSVMMIDLDDFKQVNDRFGHAAGDRVLRQFAELMKHTFETGDVVGRWGGDEFIAVLPGAGPREANRLAAALQQAARELRASEARLASPQSRSSFPSITVGTATAGRGGDVLGDADRALYRAKAARYAQRADVGS